MLDLVIIGSGPAALTAATYAARAELSVGVYEQGKIGGALSEIAHIGNFPAFDGPGQALADRLKSQVTDLGVTISYGRCESLAKSTDGVITSAIIDGEAVPARAFLIATGSEPRPLDFTPIPPVSYCALCDAPLYKGKNILVIGGGNSAIGESLMLAQVASQVTLMTHSVLKGEPSRITQLKTTPNVKIIENTEPTKANTKDYDAIFVYIGQRPATSFLPAEYLDQQGYIKTTNGHQISANLFSAGDVRSGATRQAVIAAADGATAAIEISHLLQGQGYTYGR